MGNQNDLFDGLNTAAGANAAAAGKVVKQAKGAGERVSAGGGGGGMPPHFAPLEGEFGDSLPLGRYASTQ